MQSRIKTLKDLKLFIKKDMLATSRGNFYKEFVFCPVFRFTILLRLNEYLFNKKTPLVIKIIPLFWYKRLGVRLGFSIQLNVFNYGLGIVHHGLLIVNPDARIGKNCRIHAGVNIGGSAGFKKAGDSKRYAPIIGDNTYIGPGAKLFGPITIGDNCVIGANAVVNKSFKEDNITIGGIPAKIISNKGSEGLVFDI